MSAPIPRTPVTRRGVGCDPCRLAGNAYTRNLRDKKGGITERRKSRHDRAVEILRRQAEGQTLAQIAQSLGISYSNARVIAFRYKPDTTVKHSYQEKVRADEIR